MPESAPTNEPVPSRAARSSGLRAIKWILPVLLIAWAVTALLKVGAAYSSAKEAKALLAEFRADNGGSLSGLRPLTESPDLSKVKAAGTKFEQAEGRLTSPLLAPLRVVPVLGRQLGVVDTLSSSSKSLITSVITTFNDVSAVLSRAKELPPDERAGARVSAASELERSLEVLHRSVENLDAGTDNGLVAPVREARSDFIRNRDGLLDALGDAIAVVRGTGAFLSGPNTYVVLAANNAEMRAGSGMFLQAGPLSIRNGDFQMGQFEATEDLFLDQPGAKFDPDLEALWGSFKPTQEWRNINLTPRFDESGRMATEMWRSLGRPEARGALALDIRAVQRLLDVVGPVTITQPDGTTVELTSRNVKRYLLLKQYQQFARDHGPLGREERRSYMGQVAKAIFESFNTGDLSLEQLLNALVDAGRGRHIMAWSSDPLQQAAWKALGISGELPENALLFSLINRGGNKLDQFITVSAALSAETTGRNRSVSINLQMTNTTPDGLPEYVIGPVAGSGVGAGDYVGYATLNLPAGAANPTVEGAELLAVAKDGETRVMVVKVVMFRGQQTSLRVTFDLPSAWTSIDVLPSARIPPVDWTFGSKAWRDSRHKEIVLG